MRGLDCFCFTGVCIFGMFFRLLYWVFLFLFFMLFWFCLGILEGSFLVEELLNSTYYK